MPRHIVGIFFLLLLPLVSLAGGGGDGGEGNDAQGLGYPSSGPGVGPSAYGGSQNTGIGNAGSFSGQFSVSFPTFTRPNIPENFVIGPLLDENGLSHVFDENGNFVGYYNQENDTYAPVFANEDTVVNAPPTATPTNQPDPSRFGDEPTPEAPTGPDTSSTGSGNSGPGPSSGGNTGGNSSDGSTGGSGNTGGNGSTGGSSSGNTGGNSGGNGNAGSAGNTGGNTGGNNNGNGSTGGSGNTGGNGNAGSPGGNSGPGPGVGGNDGSNPDQWWGNVMRDIGETANNIINNVTSNSQASTSTQGHLIPPSWMQIFANASNALYPAILGGAPNIVVSSVQGWFGGNQAQSEYGDYTLVGEETFKLGSMAAQEFGNPVPRRYVRSTSTLTELLERLRNQTPRSTSTTPMWTTPQTTYVGTSINITPESTACVLWRNSGIPISWSSTEAGAGGNVRLMIATEREMDAWCGVRENANTTNAITMEFKVLSASGTTLTNWSTSTSVSVPEGASLFLRWNASDYTQCLPFFNDNGRYALTVQNRSMLTGNTETEQYDLPEVSGTYRLECGGQKNGEGGVDERRVRVSMEVANTNTLNVTPNSGTAPLNVVASMYGDIRCRSYTLSWGDGSNNDYTHPSDLACTMDYRPIDNTWSHTYTEPGTYNIRLQLEGSTPLTSTITVTTQN